MSAAIGYMAEQTSSGITPVCVRALAAVQSRPAGGLRETAIEDLTPRKPRRGILTMLVEKRSGDWLIVAAQNSDFIPGPIPELDGIEPSIDFRSRLPITTCEFLAC